MNILVTGCSRGVGLEICKVFLEQCHVVYGVARSHKSLRLWKLNMLVSSFLKVLI